MGRGQSRLTSKLASPIYVAFAAHLPLLFLKKLYVSFSEFPGGLRTPMSLRLGIIVPYRDRAEHLAAFIPHLRKFFSSDPLNSHIAVRVLISEQTSGLPFQSRLRQQCRFRIVSAGHRLCLLS